MTLIQMVQKPQAEKQNHFPKSYIPCCLPHARNEQRTALQHTNYVRLLTRVDLFIQNPVLMNLINIMQKASDVVREYLFEIVLFF